MFCLRSLLTVMLMYLKLRFTYNLSLIIVSPSFVFINFYFFFFFKQKTASDMRISDWSSDVCSSDLLEPAACGALNGAPQPAPAAESFPTRLIGVRLGRGFGRGLGRRIRFRLILRRDAGRRGDRNGDEGGLKRRNRHGRYRFRRSLFHHLDLRRGPWPGEMIERACGALEDRKSTRLNSSP